MKSMKTVVAAFLAAVMVISLAACGGGSTAPAASAEETTTKGGSIFETTAPAETESGAEGEGEEAPAPDGKFDPVQAEIPAGKGATKIVTTAVQDPGGFDIFASTAFNNQYGLYESLITKGYNGYEPGIIREYTIADDGMSMEFTIDDNIFTTDGYQITAADVIWCIEKHLSGYSKSNAAIFDVSTSKVIDDTHGVLGFAMKFYPFMLNNMWHLNITSQAGYEASGDGYFYTAAGSSGPYKIESYEQGVEIVLVKNENYRGVYRTQNVDKIVIKIVPEASQRLLMLENGEIDILVDPSASDIEYIQTLDGIEYKNELSPLSYYMAFNAVQEGPLQNQKVRQAICYALDNEVICQSAYKGLREPACSAIRPDVQEWSEDVRKAAETNIYSFNLDKAKELMKEAGYEDGFEVTLIFSTNEVGQDLMAQVIQGMLSQINVTVDIQPYDKTTFKTMSSGTTDWDLLIDKCKLQDSVLFPWNDKSNANRQSIGGWYDEEFQKLLDEAIYTIDPETTLKMNAIYEDLAYHYHLTWNTVQFAYRTGIIGFETTGDNQLAPGDWIYDYDSEWLYD